MIRSLSVFARWGNQVFVGADLTPNNENEGWDGTFRGQALNPAVFVWQAVVVFIDGEEVLLSGDIMISR
ncbi:MAG: hypothetical protein IPL65_10090 [Lewinellaceae bacterium]|nr:hypothetical protein [Lewinellaceae bacterium]